MKDGAKGEGRRGGQDRLNSNESRFVSEGGTNERARKKVEARRKEYSQSSLLVCAEIALFPESHFSLETIDGVRLTEREGGGKSRKKEEEEGQLSFRSKEDFVRSLQANLP